MRSSMEHRHEEALARMRDVLQEDFLTLRIQGYQLNEDFVASTARIMCTVEEGDGEVRFGIESEGVGLIDALYKGLQQRYADEHPSLRYIRFTSFQVRGLMNESANDNGTDAKAEARIGVTNAYGTEFEFASVSSSVSQASLETVLAAVEYFVNSERAYRRMQAALTWAKQERRADLVAKYTDLLAQMVRNTSYTHLMDRKDDA